MLWRSLCLRTSGSWRRRAPWAPEREWRPGEQILVTLPDEQVVRCRVVNVLADGTVQAVPEHEVAVR
jgi:hypothetical protein